MAGPTSGRRLLKNQDTARQFDSIIGAGTHLEND
jgi:hypothetical protein